MGIGVMHVSAHGTARGRQSGLATHWKTHFTEVLWGSNEQRGKATLIETYVKDFEEFT